MADAVSNAAESVAVSALERLFAGGTVLSDGAMGTMLYHYGVSPDRCCDELNLSQPETVAAVHAEYLLAGAEIIETNTFGANAHRLRRHGLSEKVRDINLAGIQLARGCVRQFAEKQAGGPNRTVACVAGAIGPLGLDVESLGKAGLEQTRAAFAEQVRALTEGGPGVGADLLIVETMTSLAEVGEAIRVAQEVAPGLSIIVMVTVNEYGNCLDGASAEAAAMRLTDLGADGVGCNCSFGPASVLSVIERMRLVTSVPLAAMPSAGMPQLVDGRCIYPVPPDYMAGFARRLVKAGASLIGGCCGTTPDHTRAMKSALSRIAGAE